MRGCGQEPKFATESHFPVGKYTDGVENVV